MRAIEMIKSRWTKARVRFRPSSLERLEERQNPSGFGAIGALGDSITDEYRFYPPDRPQARNWVEILSTVRHANFGGFTTQSRGEPRDQGFAHNWARSDSTSTDLVSNQLPGLTHQVASGKIKYAWILTGGNDYLDFLRNTLNNPPASESAALAGLQQVQTNLIQNFETTVQTLLAANPHVKLVVATVADLGTFPVVQSEMQRYPQLTPIVSLTGQAVAQYDHFIRDIASAYPDRIALVDLQAQLGLLTFQARLNNGSLNVAGTNVNFNTAADDYHNFYLADGIHPGTIAQGAIAADFINAIDASFGARVKPIPIDQLVQIAQVVQANPGRFR